MRHYQSEAPVLIIKGVDVLQKDQQIWLCSITDDWQH